MWQCIYITIPLGKEVHPRKLYACRPILFPSANDDIVMEIHCHISGIFEAAVRPGSHLVGQCNSVVNDFLMY